jgi:hypothetical protein
MHQSRDYPDAPPPVVTERYEAVATDPYARRRDTAHKVRGLIYLFFGIIEGLLAIRFVLLALGANANAGFAALIYGLTEPLLIPFNGLFATPRLDGAVLDWNALVAIVAYALLAWILAKLAWLALGETRSAVQTSSDRVDVEHR